MACTSRQGYEWIAACYTPTAVVCDVAPPLSHCGIDRAETQSWLDSRDGSVTLESREGSLTVETGLAVYQGYTRLSGTNRPAGTPVGFGKRDTFCPRRNEAGWRIAHHHTSSPLYMGGSGKQRLVAGCQRHRPAYSKLEVSCVVRAQIFLPS